MFPSVLFIAIGWSHEPVRLDLESSKGGHHSAQTLLFFTQRSMIVFLGKVNGIMNNKSVSLLYQVVAIWPAWFSAGFVIPLDTNFWLLEGLTHRLWIWTLPWLTKHSDNSGNATILLACLSQDETLTKRCTEQAVCSFFVYALLPHNQCHYGNDWMFSFSYLLLSVNRL